MAFPWLKAPKIFMILAVRSLYCSFREQNDDNKHNFNQLKEALQIRTSAFAAEVRYELEVRQNKRPGKV